MSVTENVKHICFSHWGWEARASVLNSFSSKLTLLDAAALLPSVPSCASGWFLIPSMLEQQEGGSTDEGHVPSYKNATHKSQRPLQKGIAESPDRMHGALGMSVLDPWFCH